MTIKYYEDYISADLKAYLKKQAKPVTGVPGLTEVGPGGGLENPKSLQFLCELYESVKHELNKVLTMRKLDRDFFDQRTKACYELNKSLNIDFQDPDYETVIGHEDGNGRIVVGPKNKFFAQAGGGKPISEIPEYLKGHHVTLFGPPDDPKLSINAMNAFHRKLKNEPPIVEEVLKNPTSLPKWGADDEDSKTPLRSDLISAGENLTGCFEGNIHFEDPKTRKTYQLESNHLSLPIKRFPGLALPSLFLFLNDEPLPLHLYDFALHLFQNWHIDKALSFYVPKLETEEEARYIRLVMETAEKMIQKIHPEYKVGSIRLFIVLENPRAIFRVNEIMDELYPYFAGASLGWHDYLASTARLFKEDANYRIPVKADPDIVIKYIKASHSLLSHVVGSRGGIKIGGMYGVLPIDNELKGASFQITIKGFIKDVVTQMKRDLSGFWVAHPDFVRIGIALTEAWKSYASGNKDPLEKLVTSLLNEKYHKEILDFINGPDLVGLNPEDPLYPRSLLVADIKESNYIANNHPDEIRYNVFQALQYLTDWLSGNGCVALPAQIEGEPVRVMDDLATAERSRWEVWHEIHHGRFSEEEFLKIAHEEMLFIRKDLSNLKKIVQVKWDHRTEKWYPIALKLMIKLMTDAKPVEFASELLLPFTVETIRQAQDPWAELTRIEPHKYQLKPYIERFNFYFSACGCFDFAKKMANTLVLDFDYAKSLILNFTKSEIIEAASFHGDIGESKNTLDETASKEQALVFNEAQEIKNQLHELGQKYLKTFGFKFLVSARGKTGQELLSHLQKRLGNSADQEIENARLALWEITKKRFENEVYATSFASVGEKIQSLLHKHHVESAQVFVSETGDSKQLLNFGNSTATTWFELASLSKTVASCFAIEYFKSRGISLDTSVNSLLAKTDSDFRLKGPWAQDVQLTHLMNHTALNLHYVNGVPADQQMPNVKEFLQGNKTYGYEPIEILNEPGTSFKYSGGGFLVLEHLIEALEKKPIQQVAEAFIKNLGLQNLTFVQKTLPEKTYATGFLSDGRAVQGSRKMFPAFAAGAMGTADDIGRFLSLLTDAFQNPGVTGAISHDTAVQMLFGTDKGSLEFMQAKMGLGVFVAEAGPNRFMLHQGANDGFRCLFVHCFQGPDIGKGFVILCNADENGVSFVAETAQILLQALEFSGVNFQQFQKSFNADIPQEQKVNIGYKELVFKSFTLDLPEAIVSKGPVDPLASYNLAVGGKILSCSNQGFARAENLLSGHLPVFDPELYGRQGKIMDSWESVRHNQADFDFLEIELKKPSAISYVSLSTQFHLGNQAESIQLEAREDATKSWEIILPRTQTMGHSLKRIKLKTGAKIYSQVRVLMFPDGGFSRLGLFNESLPESEKQKFRLVDQVENENFTEVIPQSKKPLAPVYKVSAAQIAKNWSRFNPGQEVDIANLALGGKILSATNEHYSPASQVISPYPPLNMFDGSESSRSRNRMHSEQVVIGFQQKGPAHRIEIDFSYFRNNNPFEMALDGMIDGKWQVIFAKSKVKAYAGNKLFLTLPTPLLLQQLKITVYPDGGINRVRVFSRKS